MARLHAKFRYSATNTTNDIPSYLPSARLVKWLACPENCCDGSIRIRYDSKGIGLYGVERRASRLINDSFKYHANLLHIEDRIERTYSNL
ncbi:MAG TPA: hypothetical protein VJZ71_19990 [Phycisphaerae bacterium]|nr:hypothetical protein [Phycisphaerae bacterium]